MVSLTDVSELSIEDLLRLKDEMAEEVTRRQSSRRDEFFSKVEELKEMAASLRFSRAFVLRAILGQPTESDLDPTLRKRGRRRSKGEELQFEEELPLEAASEQTESPS